MVICLERDADLHMSQLMPLPLTVSCFSKIQIGFTFLVPALPGSPGQWAVKRVCVDATAELTAGAGQHSQHHGVGTDADDADREPEYISELVLMNFVRGRCRRIDVSPLCQRPL